MGGGACAVGEVEFRAELNDGRLTRLKKRFITHQTQPGNGIRTQLSTRSGKRQALQF